jgi:pimeloyl-ACP methyl ester carboxylesterase
MPGRPVRPARDVIYLHGFGSSRASSKARRFAQELARYGIELGCPDFNEPAFETLTISRMLTQVRQAVADARSDRVALIGSSLGALVALYAAVQDATGRIDRLVLLAPALEFHEAWRRELGDEAIDEWRRTGRLSVYHYADNAPRDLGFALYEDAQHYDAVDLHVAQPMLIFQGTRDPLVDPQVVGRWAAVRPNVRLRLVDDDHQLAASVALIWQESARFLLSETAPGT